MLTVMPCWNKTVACAVLESPAVSELNAAVRNDWFELFPRDGTTVGNCPSLTGDRVLLNALMVITRVKPPGALSIR